VRTLELAKELLPRAPAPPRGSGAPVSGADIFTLHDTYGFPSELTREIAAEAGVAVDMPEFERAMREQRERARADAARKRTVVAVAELPAIVSEFTGYGGLESDGVVRALVRNGETVHALHAGEEGQVVLDRTPFYAEKGGQIGDRGVIETASRGLFRVLDTQLAGEAIVHRGVIETGTLALDENAHGAVDPGWREEIRRHHTSAHLLQRALKDVLGDEVVQAGSWVGVDRMRFDFRSPGGALTAAQKRDVVAHVNALIRSDHHAVTTVMTPDEAANSGAISMAGEKYGDRVRVVRFGPSLEFCGGTHAVTTGELGMFLILSESSIGSGTRRIEAVVSKAAETVAVGQQELVGDLAERLSAQPAELLGRVDRLQQDVRDVQKTLADLKARMAGADAAVYADRAETIGAGPVVAALVPEADAAALKHLGSAIRSRLRSGTIALAGVDDGTASLFVSVSDDLVKAGVHAGNLVKVAAPHVGGKGGGAPTQAQGGGRNPQGAEAALEAIRTALRG
jgi:alanyl-tRNA synthetase